MVTQKEIGRKLKQARKELGLTQEYVANRLGIQRSSICKMERGDRQVTGVELIQLAKMYLRNPGEFLSERELPELDDYFVALFK